MVVHYAFTTVERDDLSSLETGHLNHRPDYHMSVYVEKYVGDIKKMYKEKNWLEHVPRRGDKARKAYSSCLGILTGGTKTLAMFEAALIYLSKSHICGYVICVALSQNNLYIFYTYLGTVSERVVIELFCPPFAPRFIISVPTHGGSMTQIRCAT